METLVSALRRGLRGLLEILLALWLIFEEWGWKPLAAALAKLGRLAPFAAIERLIMRLPPYAALVVFGLPSLILFPLKLVALYLIAQGYKVAAAGRFMGAKVVGTALVARIFQLTRPALMRIGWFKRGYDFLIPWKDALFAQIRASWVWRYGRVIKGRIKKTLQPVADSVRESVARLRIWVAQVLRRD